MLKLQVANSELNLGLQFVKTFAEWKFETTSYCFLWVELLNCMLLKPVEFIEN